MMTQKALKINLGLFLGFLFVLPFFVFAQASCPSQTIFSSNYATLVGEIRDTGGDPNVNAWFEWGQTPSFSNQTPTQNLYVAYTPFRFCAFVSNLQPCTTYYYRAVASNSGGFNLGETFSFKTRCVSDQTTTTTQILTSNQPSNQPPVAIIRYSPSQITPGTRVTFNALSSYDPDGYIVAYTWKVNGIFESNNAIFKRVLSSGNYEIELTVIDNKGNIDSHSVLIYVGRSVVRTRTVFQPRPIYITTAVSRTDNLVTLTLKDSYQLQKCSPSDIDFTLVNNTSVKRKVTIEVESEARSWFDPQQKEFFLNPEEGLEVNWRVYPPCQIDDGKYLVTFRLSTPGFTKNYQATLEVKSRGFTNPFSALASLIFSNFPWFLVLVLLIIIAILAYNYARQKSSTQSS